jgi:hypothetical protein
MTQAALGTGMVSPRLDFRPSQVNPTKVTRSGEVIIDSSVESSA